jgi:hypothetical protein
MQRLLDLLGVCSLAAVTSFAQAATTATVKFQYENQQLRPPKYLITLNEDGSGQFHAEGSPANPDDPAALPSEAQDRPIQLPAAATERIFKLARAKKFFAMACDSGDAKVAFTGKKMLAYEGSDGHGACTYIYSKDQQVTWLTSEMQGIAATLEEGHRLELQHEHGRLSLDAELETLENMVQNGQATELETIAPILVDIVKDGAVLERAQKRARHLLSIVDAATP